VWELPEGKPAHRQVWVVGELQDGKLKWRADSDSQLTKVCTCCPVLSFPVQTGDPSSFESAIVRDVT
jgi:hypothetical protein